MTQGGLNFDSVTFYRGAGEKAKWAGMDAAATKRMELLDMAREIAVCIAKQRGIVTADDVQKVLIDRGYSPADLGNAAGSIFRRNFIWTGQFINSERVCAHSNLLRVWKLKG